MRTLVRLVLGVAALVGLGFVGLLLYGPERAWERIAPSDLGPVDFARLTRSPTPNDALAATPGALPDGAPAADIALPAFDATPAALLEAVDARATAEGAERVAADGTTLRFVTRSPRLRFPDTTVVEAVPLPDGRIGLRAYARASVGHSDLGANAARLERWLTGLPGEAS